MSYDPNDSGSQDSRTGVKRTISPEIIEVSQDRTVLEKKYVGRLQKGSTTPSVKNLEHVDAVNSGAVSITDFLFGQDGQSLYIRGDGFTTIVNGTKIKTNTAGNKLLNANVIYFFNRRSGIWYEINDTAGGGGGGGSVTSVFGRTGAVITNDGDYDLSLVPAKVVTKTAAYTIVATDYMIRADASTVPFTLTLPAAAPSSGDVFVIKRINAGANNVTVQGNGAETIDGANTAVLTTQWEVLAVISNGTSWDII